jgi:GTP-binding protein HflX
MLKPLPKVFLVILQTGRKNQQFLDESLAEMKELAASAGVRTVGTLQAYIADPSPSHLVREGKLKEIAVKAKAASANVLYFNVDLTPVQARNIEKDIKYKSVDRTGLILDIFGKRAKSNEGKLQVELARLNYLLPRLGGLGTVLSRLGGGVGTRGPGEQELEWDRRKIRRRIESVKDDLKKVEKHRQLMRDGRKKRRYISAALVGYTNAGKSTLLNALTGADSYVADQLFATLDPKTRMQSIDDRKDILFIDTVGFIRDLPHTLVEAFHATLEEVIEADFLVHVLDVSSPHAQEMQAAVEKVLKEIKALHKPTVLALNKADLLNEEERRRVQKNWPDGILISAKQGLGLRSLLAKLEKKEIDGKSTHPLQS